LERRQRVQPWWRDRCVGKVFATDERSDEDIEAICKEIITESPVAGLFG
jgi:hypothetical protein